MKKYGWGRLRKEEKLIIALLNEDYKAAETLISAADLDFEHIWRLGHLHRIAPLVFERLLDNFPEKLPAGIKKQYQLYILKQLTLNKARYRELIETARLLSDSGYDAMLMKGLAYDLEETVPRVFEDVDILVGEEEIHDVIELLQDREYEYVGSFILSREEKRDIESQLSWNNQYPFYFPHTRHTIEIHTNLFERDRIRLEDLKTLLDNPGIYKTGRIWSGELHCYVPSAEASLLLLCLQCSLKRSLHNDKFILRHMVDMETLLSRGIDGRIFLSLCRESRTCLHAFSTLTLWMIIGNRNPPAWFSELREELTRKERFVVHRHLKCMKNLRSSSRTGRLLYNFTAPFIIGGSARQRFTWLRNNVFATRVEQENRYYRWGFKKESPLIYLTYLFNPFQTGWRFIKKILGIKNNSLPGS